MIRRCILPAIGCVAVLCIAAAFVLSSNAQDRSPQNPTSELQQLREKVAQLESRVAALEKKPPYVVLPSKPIAAPYGGHQTSPLPRGWTEQVFNGMKYYIVPLSTDKSAGTGSRPPHVRLESPGKMD